MCTLRFQATLNVLTLCSKSNTKYRKIEMGYTTKHKDNKAEQT